VRTGQAAVERAFGKTIFERNAETPEEAALFNEAMASHSAALSAPLMAGAPALLQASGVEARCEVVGGSFFDGVPPGADAYLLRAILHDWDDESSIAILKSIRKAMAKDSVLLIVECVLPEKAEAGNAVDSYLLDLEMLVNSPGGRERSEAEFREILNAAGFGPLRLIPTSTATSLLEARPA
jgi:O-methyltransferase domain